MVHGPQIFGDKLLQSPQRNDTRLGRKSYLNHEDTVWNALQSIPPGTLLVQHQPSQIIEESSLWQQNLGNLDLIPLRPPYRGFG